MRVLIILLLNVCASLALGRKLTKVDCSKISCQPGKPICVHIKQSSQHDYAYWFKLLSYVYMHKCDLQHLTCKYGDIGKIVPLKMCKARNPIRTFKARRKFRPRHKRRAPVKDALDDNAAKGSNGDNNGDSIVSDNTCKGDIAENVEIDVPGSCRISTRKHTKGKKKSNYMKVDLHPEAPDQGPAVWEIKDYGATIHQKNKRDASVMVGCSVFAGLDFSGYVMVDGVVDNNHIGFVFGYQSNKRFYVMTWKGAAEFYSVPGGDPKDEAYARAGVHVKLVNSSTGPSTELRQALWRTESTPDQVTLLWLDPKTQGWKPKKLYKWHLVHRPHIGVIRIKIYTNDNKQLFLDSGNIYDNTIKGGRAGLYSFSQPDVIWTDLRYRCNDTIPHDVFVELPMELKKNAIS